MASSTFFASSKPTQDELEPQQVNGVAMGLSRDEVLGLDDDQIQAMLKNGLSKEEVTKLTDIQIEALLALKQYNVTDKHLRGQDWFDDAKYITAMIYFLTRTEHNEKILTVLESLQTLTPLQALACVYSLEPELTQRLEKHQIKELIEFKKYQILYDNIHGLGKHQINLLKELYYFGLTREQAIIFPDDRRLCEALTELVTRKGMPINEAVATLEDLSGYQARGILAGLTKEEVKVLTEYQVYALAACKTTRNGLTAQDLQGKDWFNSQEHVEALEWMLKKRFLTSRQAMAELDGLTSYRANQVAQEIRKRDDIVGLTKCQLDAIDNEELYENGLRGHHLRGKDWFNSKAHIKELLRLYRCANSNMEVAVQRIDGFDEKKLWLLHWFKREEILKLTPIQLKILTNTNEYHIRDDFHLVQQADWLITEKQAELVKAIAVGTLDTLALVRKVSSQENGVSDLLQKIQNNEITYNEVQELAYAARMEMFASKKDAAQSNDGKSQNNEGYRCALI